MMEVAGCPNLTCLVVRFEDMLKMILAVQGFTLGLVILTFFRQK